MKVARLYRFRLRFLTAANLPKWKGNLLRGALGYQLKRLVGCRDDCRDCGRLFACPFGYLYRARSKGIVLRKVSGYAKPYVVKPPLDAKTGFERGDRLEFSVVLFGDAARFEGELVKAVEMLCGSGLGVRGSAGRLELEEVAVENPFTQRAEVVYAGGEHYDGGLWIRDSHLEIEVPEIFEVEFLTPFRIVRGGALVVEPDFRTLTTYMLRKYSAIRYQYVLSELDVDIERVLDAAARIRLRSSQLRDVRVVYKGREEPFVFGRILYSGRTNKSIRKLLAFCQLSHVGKRASYGHGWFRVRAPR